MQICCTKRLLDELGDAPEAVKEEEDFFCWSANLIIVNRRKTVVVTNDSNRFGFVLHGLKSKDFANLKQLIIQGIITSLKDRNIKEEVINRYLDAGGEPSITKTRGRGYASRLSKACQMVEFFYDKFDPMIVYQSKVSEVINNDYVKIGDLDYGHPKDLLEMDFRKFAGDQLISCKAAVLIIKLDLGMYTAWRRLVTPVNIDFKKLHNIIQTLFNWRDCHLHDFNVFDDTGKCVINVISKNEEIFEPREDCRMVMEEEAVLSDYIDKNYKIIYCYDFGDNWVHEIIIESIVHDYDKNYPSCLAGEGNAPPEDVGGIPGYEEFVRVMSNPEDPEYKETQQWADSKWYKDFDINMINRSLKR